MVPTGPLQATAAVGAAAFNAGLALVTKAPGPIRRAGAGALRLLSPSGGPRPERLESWRWSLECEVRGTAGESARSRVDAEGHPGYLATSRMTAEAGLILGDAAASVPRRAGVLTPATALGIGELERFAAAGVRFS